MSAKMKTWLIIGASLILVGGMIFTGVMIRMKWDFTKLSTTGYETNEYEIHEDYQDISILTKTADILFLPAENGESTVSCFEIKNAKHTVSVKDGTLAIEIEDTRKWYEHIGIHFGVPKITVCIPKGQYGTLTVRSSTGDMELPADFTFERIDITESTGNVTSCASAAEDIKITTSTGNIHVENISSKALDLSVSTGKISVTGADCTGEVAIRVSTGKAALTDLNCSSVISEGNTGDITLKNVIAQERFSINRSTGDVRFEASDAAEIYIETDTGDVTGSLLSDKIFITQSDTGSIDVPKTTSGGRCEITTDTGNIKITID